MIKVRITPLRIGNYFEPCMMEFSGSGDDKMYPTAIVHIDTFWEQGGSNELYSRLMKGEVVEIILSMVTRNTEP